MRAKRSPHIRSAPSGQRRGETGAAAAHGELLFGVHPIREALRAGRRTVHELLVGNAGAADQVDPRRTVPRRVVSAQELSRLTDGGVHQQIAARAGPLPLLDLRELLDLAADDPQGPFLVVLDQVQDPHNVGAIARTALGCGAHGLVIPKDHACPLTGVVAKSSAGAIEWLPIAQVTNLASALKQLQDADVWVVGLAADATQSLYAYEFRGGHAIVMGAEGKGLRRLTSESCDTLIKIPMHGAVESLNVSVAAAMTLGEVMRQRMGAG